MQPVSPKHSSVHSSPDARAKLAFVSGGVYEELTMDSSDLAKQVVRAAHDIANHPAHTAVKTLPDVRTYMKYHVWCVWDFMSLAKAVQIAVGWYRVPWVPPADASLVGAMNDIIAGEEADIAPSGRQQSHFEIYCDAMTETGASIEAIARFIAFLRQGMPAMEAMSAAGAPDESCRFVKATLDLASGPPHVAVAAFCLGREELVPNMLSAMLTTLPKDDPRLAIFMWYVHRHIALDTDVHGPLSGRLFRAAVKDSKSLREEALQAALRAIESRHTYLDAIHAAVLAAQ